MTSTSTEEAESESVSKKDEESSETASKEASPVQQAEKEATPTGVDAEPVCWKKTKHKVIFISENVLMDNVWYTVSHTPSQPFFDSVTGY